MKLTSLLAITLFCTASSVAQTRVTEASYGTTPAGEAVSQYTLSDKMLAVKIITYGAKITDILAPDREGKRADVVLGYKDLAGYVQDDSTHFGSTIGRYGNRVGGGTFTLEGHTYKLSQNNGSNTLHGGVKGFDSHVWSAKKVANGVELTLVSPDGDQGFPGNMTAHVRFTLVGPALHIAYSATTDKPTVITMTNHSYFNLAGSGNVLAQVAEINADRYTPVDDNIIPTGQLAPVAGTPFDFRTPKPLGERIDADDPQIKLGHGYDHNYVLNKNGKPAAVMMDPASGRTLTVKTTEPGMQLYTSNFLEGKYTGRDGIAYTKNSGFCLETEHFPDTPNHPAFPSAVLRPGQTYHSETTFTFGVK